MAASLELNQSGFVYVNWTDEYGNAMRVQGETRWESSDVAIVTVTPVQEDSRIASLQAIKSGHAQVFATADVDRSDGKQRATAVFVVTVIPGDMVGGWIKPLAAQDGTQTIVEYPEQGAPSGGYPQYPGEGLPIAPGELRALIGTQPPTEPPPTQPTYPDNTLPPEPEPPPIDPDAPTGPVYPDNALPPAIDNALPQPPQPPDYVGGGLPVYPDNGLPPGMPERPDNALPGTGPVDPGFGGGAPIYPGHGLPIAPVRPDNALPGAQPKT